MRVKAWRNRARYGIRVGKENARHYFQDNWPIARINIDERSHAIRLAGRNWAELAVLQSEAIGAWLEIQGLVPWEKGHPPELELQPLGENQFRLSLVVQDKPRPIVNPEEGPEVSTEETETPKAIAENGPGGPENPPPPKSPWPHEFMEVLRGVGYLGAVLATPVVVLVLLVSLARKLIPLASAAIPRVQALAIPVLVGMATLWALRALSRLDGVVVKFLGYAAVGIFYFWLFFYVYESAPLLTHRLPPDF